MWAVLRACVTKVCDMLEEGALPITWSNGKKVKILNLAS